MALRFCVICGRGSDRVWNNISASGVYVACDFHSNNEFQLVISGTVQTPGPNVENIVSTIDESTGA